MKRTLVNKNLIKMHRPFLRIDGLGLHRGPNKTVAHPGAARFILSIQGVGVSGKTAVGVQASPGLDFMYCMVPSWMTATFALPG